MAAHNVLVVAAHPDDEVLGAGGAIARHREEGDSVIVLILGEGIVSRAGVSKGEALKQQKKLQTDAVSASAVLGAPSPMLRSFPDNSFDSVPLLSIVREIETVVKETKPDLIYTHHAGDVNIDHRVVAEAVDAVVRPLENARLTEVRAFEIASSSDWNFTRSAFRPNIFVALSEVQLQKKIDAMRAYTSEIRPFPHPRSPEYLEALARVRGGQSGFRAAEAFALIYARYV